MKIRSFIHKGLQRLYTEANPKGVPPDSVEKLRKMLGFLDAMEDPEELRTLTAWKAHTMTGDRKGTVSLSVTRNRRLTFRINAAEPEIYDVNLEVESAESEGKGWTKANPADEVWVEGVGGLSGDRRGWQGEKEPMRKLGTTRRLPRPTFARHSEGVAYNLHSREIAACRRVGRMGPPK